MKPEYTEYDIDWMVALLGSLKNNGTWACPCSRTTFQFDKQAKTYKLVNGSPDNPTNRITIAILERELDYRREES